MVIGTVLALTLRPARTLAPAPVASARAAAGAGLEGDLHADPRSPRQLLLAGAAVYRELALDAHALGENLLLDLDTSPLVSGTILQIGPEVRLRLMFQCEACGQLDAVRPGLARVLGARRGMLARVIAGGALRVGDTVRDLGRLAPPWPNDWRERVRRVLDAMPPGALLEYRQLARLAGIQSSYCRAFPRLLAKFGPAYAARAVPAGASAGAPRWQGEGLFDLPPDASGAG